AARRDQFRGGGKWTASLFIASAAAAAMASPEEKTLREQLIESEASPADIAAADFLTAVYGFRESESSYHAVRSRYPSRPASRLGGRSEVDRATLAPAAAFRSRGASPSGTP